MVEKSGEARRSNEGECVVVLSKKKEKMKNDDAYVALGGAVPAFHSVVHQHQHEKTDAKEHVRSCVPLSPESSKEGKKRREKKKL